MKIEEQESNKPIKKFRMQGSNVNVTLWLKNGFVTATIERRYKDEKGEWQTSHSLSPSEMHIASRLLSDACKWVGSENE